MIIYAFSTLGKTDITKNFPGQYWDFAVNRISKQFGYNSYKPLIAEKLCDVLQASASYFKAIFISIVDEQIMRCLAHQDLIIILPKYGVNEFRKRLFDRYGQDYVHSDEWINLGHCYAERIHTIEKLAKRYKVPIEHADHLSDVLFQLW